MHHHVYYDTNVSILHQDPELVYRNRGMPLSGLHNCGLLGRSRNVITRLQKDYCKDPLINSLVDIDLSFDLKGFVSSCGEHSNELELVGYGGQFMIPSKKMEHTNKSKLLECFEDIMALKYSQAGADDQKNNNMFSMNHDIMSTLKMCHETKERPNGLDAIRREPLRLKRLSLMIPNSFKEDRVLQIRVDNKIKDCPFVYARNQNGLFVCRLYVSESTCFRETTYPSFNDSHSVNSYFPTVKPYVVTDMPFTLDNHINTMFVSPHEYGVWAATTRKKQLVVWDSTISGPCSKVDLLKSTEKHLSYGEMYNKWYGCIAADVLDCGTFTDRHDVLLLGGSKLYLVDLRSRAVGYLFPSPNVRPPSTYRFPKLSSRLPLTERLLAIEQHPTSPCLYAMVSGVSSSILLWDIRNPSEVIGELPLPLIRQGRSRFRHLNWSKASSVCDTKNTDNMWFLSSFCWDYNACIVNCLSVYDSKSVTHHNEQDIKERLQKEIHETFDKQSKGETTLNNIYSDDILTTSQTKFWSNYFKHRQKRSPFFVNPFLTYPLPSRCDLPVCDSSGLCFLSSRPPLQIVIYHQIQIPIGIPSKKSERDYFQPLGPILTCSETLINEGLHTSLNELPLSQLFHGIAGITILRWNVLNEKKKKQEKCCIVACLTFSGRIIFSRLKLNFHKRRTMLSQNTICPQAEKTTSSPLINQLINEFNFPTSFRSKKSTLLSHIPFIDELLKKRQHETCSQDTQDQFLKKKNSLSPTWNPFLKKDFIKLKTSFTGFFHIYSQEDIKKSFGLRGYHELLCPNNDSLDYPTFAMSSKVNFCRQRLDTALYWRYPDLNGIFYAEVLLDFLCSLDALNGMRTKTYHAPILLPTISQPLVSLKQEPQHMPTKWTCVKDVLHWLTSFCSSSTLTPSITLFEIFEKCDSTVKRKELIHALKECVNQQSLVCYVASTAGVDQTFVELLTIPRGEHFEWKPLANRIATPLCSCEAFLHYKPIRLDPDNAWMNGLWIGWSAQETSLIYESFLRSVAYFNYALNPKRTMAYETVTKEMLTRLADLLFHELIPVIPYKKSFEKSIKEMQATVYPQCNIEMDSNSFCSLPFVLVFQTKTASSHSTNEDQCITQGRSFISINEEDFNKASRREQEFILKHSPRDYPAYYAFLTGIRVTEHLYCNLKKEWRINEINTSSSTYLFNESTSMCSLSSITNLLKFASNAAKEAATQLKTKSHHAAVGALASQMKQVISQKTLASSMTSKQYTSPSISAALQQFSQDFTCYSQPDSIEHENSQASLPAILRYGIQLNESQPEE